MKTLILLSVSLSLTMGVIGQSFKNAVPRDRFRQAAPAMEADLPAMPSQPGNFTANSKAALEQILGGSRYDMQTNQSMASRLILYPDGTMSAAWTMGFQETAFPDRGTGYNYFDGSAWQAPPAARIESFRTGWPCIQPWNGNGEIIACHTSGTSNVFIESRPVKGTGAWTVQTLLPPAGASGIGWPRLMTSGPDHNFIHLIMITTPTASGGTAFQGLDPALIYYRSSDGGTTWDQEAVILPQLTSADYDGFAADSYVWGTPHGDTIYFAVGSPYVDTFIMQSTDNGNTWTKIPILSNANKKIPAGTTYLPEWKSSDGSMAVELDHSGIYHVAFGVGAGFIDSGSKYIVGNYNGLVYWNSTMPMVKDSLDLDTLDAHGQLLGYAVNGPGPGDTLVAVPFYRTALTSFPQITVDDFNNIYFIWSQVVAGNPSPDPYNYRHIWGRARFNHHGIGDPIDLNEGVLYMFQEYVYISLAKALKGDYLQMIYQTSAQPGSNIASSEIPVHDVNIEYRQEPYSIFPIGVGTRPAVTPVNFYVGPVFPNPASNQTSFELKIAAAARVSVRISDFTGQQMMSMDQGEMAPGRHQISLDVSRLTPGIYFYTVSINGEKVTRKMIVGS